MVDIKWGIVRRNFRYPHPITGKLQDEYKVAENSEVKFTTLGRRIAVDLSYAEAVALCAILNAGQT